MQLRYDLNRADVAAARRLFLWRRRRVFCWGYTLFSALFFLFGVFNLAIGFPGLAVVPLVVGALGTAYLPVVAPYRSALTMFPKRKGTIPVAITTSAEEVEISTSLSRSTFRWAAFSDFIEGPTVWILFVNPLSYHIIPNASLCLRDR